MWARLGTGAAGYPPKEEAAESSEYYVEDRAGNESEVEGYHQSHDKGNPHGFPS